MIQLNINNNNNNTDQNNNNNNINYFLLDQWHIMALIYGTQ